LPVNDRAKRQENYVHRRVLSAIGAAILVVVVVHPAQALAQPASPHDHVSPTRTAGSQGVARKTAATPSALKGRICSPHTKGRYTCLAPAAVHSLNTRKPSVVSPDLIVTPPEWCIGDGMYGTRTEVCEITGASLTTYRVVNGVEEITGELDMDVYNYSYTSPDLGNWVHQISFAAWDGFGPAVEASVSGIAAASGSCTSGSSSFPAQSMQPFLTLRSGEAGFNTTATAAGAVGYCTTIWDITFTVPQHPPAELTESMSEIRCDNAVGANGFRPARVGCVVPWYASAAGYSQSSYPSLAGHVSRAQASGLPGATFADPLWRNTDTTITNTNRSLACGDAPSIAGKSCDEYPLASTYNGLAFGGTRRTFPGCNINAPSGTGPIGASACMITASENSAQGAIMAAFYYDERVLDIDPYRILVTA